MDEFHSNHLCIEISANQYDKTEKRSRGKMFLSSFLAFRFVLNFFQIGALKVNDIVSHAAPVSLFQGGC